MCSMQIPKIGKGVCSFAKNTPKLVRKNLSQKSSVLRDLAGPAEKSRARKRVAMYSAGNAVIAAATAQAPGVDEAILSGVEVTMAMDICKNVYKFKNSESIVSSLLAGFTGNRIGSWLFKSVSWIPGVGNAINAGVAGCTTAAIGEGVITACEKMEKNLKRGEKIDEFIKKMEE